MFSRRAFQMMSAFNCIKPQLSAPQRPGHCGLSGVFRRSGTWRSRL